jgi:hypothetical protein
MQKDLAAEDAIGKSFLMPPEDDGTRHRARIIEIIKNNVVGLVSVSLVLGDLLGDHS